MYANTTVAALDPIDWDENGMARSIDLGFSDLLHRMMVRALMGEVVSGVLRKFEVYASRSIFVVLIYAFALPINVSILKTTS